jgi:hypothetical protein
VGGSDEIDEKVRELSQHPGMVIAQILGGALVWGLVIFGLLRLLAR